MKERWVIIIPIPGYIEHMQLCGLGQLWRYPRQSVLSYTEDIQTSAAPDLDNGRDQMIRERCQTLDRACEACEHTIGHILTQQVNVCL